MKAYLITILFSASMGGLLSVLAYKKLQHTQAPAAAVVEDNKASTQTQTILRYIDREGKPVVKETIVTNVVEKHAASVPAPIERRKNLIGIQSTLDGKGKTLVGPQYGRELFPNTYLTGGILLTPQGQPKSVTAGIQIAF